MFKTQEEFNYLKTVFLAFFENEKELENKLKKGIVETAKYYKISLEDLENLRRRKTDFVKNFSDNPDYTVSDYFDNSSGYYIKEKKETIVREMGYDPDEFKIAEMWVKDSEGQSVRLVKNESKEQKQVKEYNQIDFKFTPYKPPTDQKDPYGNLMAVICMFDCHFGKVAEEKYTDNKLNLVSTKEKFFKHFNSIYERLPENLEKVVFPIGNDFFNVDNSHLTTTAGTKQDNIQDVQEMYKVGLECLFSVIQTLSTYYKVEVPLVVGNHDYFLSQVLASSLKLLFAENQNVTIDDSPMTTKYLRYYNNLVVLDHGELKPDQYLSRIIEMRPKDFVEAEYVEVLLGHLHHEKIAKVKMTSESKALSIRNLAALTGTDRWHHKQNYIGATKRAYCIFYDKNYGRSMELISQSR